MFSLLPPVHECVLNNSVFPPIYGAFAETSCLTPSYGAWLQKILPFPIHICPCTMLYDIPIKGVATKAPSFVLPLLYGMFARTPRLPLFTRGVASETHPFPRPACPYITLCGMDSLAHARTHLRLTLLVDPFGVCSEPSKNCNDHVLSNEGSEFQGLRGEV